MDQRVGPRRLEDGASRHLVREVQLVPRHAWGVRRCAAMERRVDLDPTGDEQAGHALAEESRRSGDERSPDGHSADVTGRCHYGPPCASATT